MLRRKAAGDGAAASPRSEDGDRRDSKRDSLTSRAQSLSWRAFCVSSAATAAAALLYIAVLVPLFGGMPSTIAYTKHRVISAFGGTLLPPRGDCEFVLLNRPRFHFEAVYAYASALARVPEIRDRLCIVCRYCGEAQNRVLEHWIPRSRFVGEEELLVTLEAGHVRALLSVSLEHDHKLLRDVALTLQHPPERPPMVIVGVQHNAHELYRLRPVDALCAHPGLRCTVAAPADFMLNYYAQLRIDEPQELTNLRFHGLPQVMDMAALPSALFAPPGDPTVAAAPPVYVAVQGRFQSNRRNYGALFSSLLRDPAALADAARQGREGTAEVGPGAEGAFGTGAAAERARARAGRDSDGGDVATPTAVVAAVADTAAPPPPSLVFVGKGELDLPAPLDPHAKVFREVPDPQFYSLLRGARALLTLIGSEDYYRSKTTSTVAAALGLGIPLVAECRLLDLYPCLRDSGLRQLCVQSDEEWLDKVAAVLRMAETEVEQARREVAACNEVYLARNAARLREWFGVGGRQGEVSGAASVEPQGGDVDVGRALRGS